MNKLFVPAVVAAFLLSACSATGAPPTSQAPAGAGLPTDAAGVQQLFETAVAELQVDQISSVSIDQSRFDVVGHRDPQSVDASVYSLEPGQPATISQRPATTEAAIVTVAASEIDFGARYEAARSAMSQCTEEIYVEVSLAPNGQQQTRGRCGGYAGSTNYLSLADQELGPAPDFSTADGAAEILRLADLLGVQQLAQITVFDTQLTITTDDQSVPGAGGQCRWQADWSPEGFGTGCITVPADGQPFGYAEINKQTFGQVVADVYAHSGQLDPKGVTVGWLAELGEPAIYTMVPPATPYGYRLDGSPLQ